MTKVSFSNMERNCADRDPESVNHSNERLKSLVNATLNYLDSRIEFWRQQKPIYARKKSGFKAKNSATDENSRFVLEKKQIDVCLRNIERGDFIIFLYWHYSNRIDSIQSQ